VIRGRPPRALYGGEQVAVIEARTGNEAIESYAASVGGTFTRINNDRIQLEGDAPYTIGFLDIKREWPNRAVGARERSDIALLASDVAWTLNPGETIRRVDLHREYGGSSYGGMAPSSTSPNVFLFTDPAVGHRHGYFDGWVGRVFHYTGMGQRADQEFKAGNRAVRDHQVEHRAIRMFRGAGGRVTYLGEFALDSQRPFYRTDAPETGGGPIRQVIVFRLVPLGDVIHDEADSLTLPEGFSPAEVDAATASTTHAVLTEVPVEQQHTEQVLVNPAHEPYEAERREQTLVLTYKRYLEARGSVVTRHRVQPPGEAKPLLSDVYDKTRNNLIEAKGTGTCAAIRIAIGQLADYSRFIARAPAQAVLLPHRPRPDLEALLTSQNISAVWQDGSGFTDNAGGAFT
jgi:hypothetical protein